jgi:hypothetical protein
VITESVVCVWLADKPKDKKMSIKTKAAKVSVSVVREPVAIDQMFKRNSLGYLTSDSKADIAIDDAVGYVVSKLDAGQSAIRDAILFSAWVFKNKPEEQSKAYSEQLKARWNGSTTANLISISKLLPSLEDKGLAIDQVRDLYGLRDCGKLLRSESPQEAIALLNAGESPRAVQKKLNPSDTPAKEEKTTSAPAPVNFADEADKLETLLLSYTDKYSKIAEGEARIKIARQIIAKLNLGGYILMHADAAAAVKTLKEGKK